MPTASPRAESATESRSRVWTTTAMVVVALETALSLLLGSVHLGSKSFWQDEGFSAMLSQGSWSDALHVIRHQDPNMSGYHILLRFWQVLGVGESSLRSLSVLATAATVPMLFLLGRKLYDERTGLIAGVLFATAPFMVRYEQEARSYALLVLMVVVASYFFVRSLDADGDRFWLPYAGAAGSLIYLHFFGALVVVAHAVSWLVRSRTAADSRRAVKQAVVIGVLWTPGLLLFAIGPRSQLSWIEFSRAIVTTETRTLAGGRALLVATAIAVVIAGVVAVRALRSRQGMRAWNVCFPLVWTAVPFAFALAYSVLADPFFVSRYLIVTLPALVLVISMVVTLIKARWLLLVVVAALIVASSLQIRDWYDAEQIEDWPAVVASVTRNTATGDGIIFCNTGYRPVFEYYLRNVPSDRWPIPLSPSDPWGWGVHESVGDESMVTGRRSPARVWLITATDLDESARCPAARKGRSKVVEEASRGIVVQLWG